MDIGSSDANPKQVYVIVYLHDFCFSVTTDLTPRCELTSCQTRSQKKERRVCVTGQISVGWLVETPDVCFATMSNQQHAVN